MANTDSFIDEVSEEVRRDRLFALFKRWGWVPVLLVIGIVGGATYLEWQKAQVRAQSQAFGDALLTALDTEDPQARIAALEAIETANPEARIILALLAASEASAADDPAGAAAMLRAAADAPGVDRRYVDLALLKAEMLDPGEPDEARLILEAIAVPGAPYAALAEEQLALLDIRTGDLAAGLDRLRAIERSAAATAGLQQRAAQLIVALEGGATLVDTAPEAPLVPTAVPLQMPDAAPVEETPAEAEDAEEAQAPAADDTAPAGDDETPAEDPAPAVED
jgi:hypothetical protein